MKIEIRSQLQIAEPAFLAQGGMNEDKPQICPTNETGHSSPTVPGLNAWMTSDRAIDCQCAILAASSAFQAVLHELPNADIIPSETELSTCFLPAAVNVSTGTILPVKDLEKLRINRDNSSGHPNRSSGEQSLSLDLVSEIVLDVFMKLVRKWEDVFTSLWTASQDNWDW